MSLSRRTVSAGSRRKILSTGTTPWMCGGRRLCGRNHPRLRRARSSRAARRRVPRSPHGSLARWQAEPGRIARKHLEESVTWRRARSGCTTPRDPTRPSARPVRHHVPARNDGNCPRSRRNCRCLRQRRLASAVVLGILRRPPRGHRRPLTLARKRSSAQMPRALFCTITSTTPTLTCPREVGSA